MTRADAIAAAVADDRRAMAVHAERYCADVRALAGRGRLAAGEADMLCRRISAFAADIQQGLHCAPASEAE